MSILKALRAGQANRDGFDLVTPDRAAKSIQFKEDMLALDHSTVLTFLPAR